MGQISVIPKPELRGFWKDSLTKPPFKVTSAEVVIICPDTDHIPVMDLTAHGEFSHLCHGQKSLYWGWETSHL